MKKSSGKSKFSLILSLILVAVISVSAVFVTRNLTTYSNMYTAEQYEQQYLKGYQDAAAKEKELVAKLKDCQAELADKTAKLAANAQTIITMTNRIEELEDALADKTLENEQNVDLLTQTQKLLLEKKAELASLAEENKNYRFEIENLQTRVDELEDEINSLVPISSTFSENDWRTISYVSHKISTQNLTSEQVFETYGWSIGDEKAIRLSTNETITVLIIGFNHDNKSDLTGKAGITLGMKDLMLSKESMNSTASTEGGWRSSAMRRTKMDAILNSLDSELQSVIKLVDKEYASAKNAEIAYSSDRLFLFSEVEINKNATRKDEGRQYEYYEKVDGSVSRNRKKKLGGTGEYCDYWLRSIESSNAFNAFTEGGYFGYAVANQKMGICFGFCV